MYMHGLYLSLAIIVYCSLLRSNEY